MKIQMNKVKCVADRSYNKDDDMHLMASIKSRLDKGLKPLLQPIALKKLDEDPNSIILWKMDAAVLPL